MPDAGPVAPQVVGPGFSVPVCVAAPGAHGPITARCHMEGMWHSSPQDFARLRVRIVILPGGSWICTAPRVLDKREPGYTEAVRMLPSRPTRTRWCPPGPFPTAMRFAAPSRPKAPRRLQDAPCPRGGEHDVLLPWRPCVEAFEATFSGVARSFVSNYRMLPDVDYPPAGGSTTGKPRERFAKVQRRTRLQTWARTMHSPRRH